MRIKSQFYIVIILAVLCVIPFLVTGCSSEEVYQTAMEHGENTKKQLKELSDENLSNLSIQSENAEDAINQGMYQGTLFLSKKARRTAPFIIVGSLTIGILMLFISTKTASAKIKQAAWLLFLTGIPVLTVVVVYGLAFFNSWFT